MVVTLEKVRCRPYAQNYLVYQNQMTKRSAYVYKRPLEDGYRAVLDIADKPRVIHIGTVIHVIRSARKWVS